MKGLWKRTTAFLLSAIILISFAPRGILLANEEDGSDPVAPVLEEEAPRDSNEEGSIASDAAPLGETVTVSFVIDKPEYTCDPGSEQTHITAKTPYENSDLSFSSWAGTYKVSGIGTLCSVTLPQNSSLSDNGLSFPALDVINITAYPANTYEYFSLRSWVSANGQIYDTSTVVTQDTVLYLSLYSNDETHSLDFICCDEHCHSFSYYLADKTATFRYGQAVSSEYILSVDQTVAYYENNLVPWFPYDVHTPSQLTGWALKNVETDVLVPFHAGMPITEDYRYPYGNDIKVYAIWQEPQQTVTASFVIGENTTETRSYQAGDALGALPAVAAPVGQLFLGWQYTNAENALLYASEDTQIEEDTVFTAVFAPEEEPIYYNIHFHDIKPDGSEGDLSIETSLLAGSAFTQVSDVVLYDDTPLSECVWYTLNDGVRTLFDFANATVSQSLELYTYSHALSLHYASLSEERTVTVNVREGQLLTADALVIDGVDYTTYNWSVLNEDGIPCPFELDGLVGQPLEENMTLSSDGSAHVILTPDTGHKVNFFIFIDGQRVLLESRLLTSYTMGGDRHYIAATDLESVYAPFGFAASQLVAGTYYFPHVDQNGGKIWADTPAVAVNGIGYSPVTNHKGNVDVYYLPYQSIAGSSANWDSVKQGESFYSITVSDTDGIVYSPADLPGVQYFLRDTNATITLSQNALLSADVVEWICEDAEGNTVAGTINAEEDTVTFTIANINKPYTVTAALGEGSARRVNVSVADPTGLVYVPAALPESREYIEGSSVSISVSTLPITPGTLIEWICEGDDGRLIEGVYDTLNNTVSFVILSIDQNYTLTPSAVITEVEGTVIYNVNKPKNPLFPEYDTPLIEGAEEYIFSLEEGITEHVLLSPSVTGYLYSVEQYGSAFGKYLGEAIFQGWSANGSTSELLQPGALIDLIDYNGALELIGVWSTEYANNQQKTNSMVNFYVSLAAHPNIGSFIWTGQIEQVYFTDSVFTDDCGVDCILVPQKNLYIDTIVSGNVSQYVVIGGTSGTNVNDNHNEIVSKLGNGFTKTGSDGLDYTFQCTFPTDEAVMQRIRMLINQGGNRSHILINGHEISADEMTAENFSVRWYVFKYDITDGWHIDGVLVSKEGRLKVTKTFAGDAEAIAAVKANYSICVTPEADQIGIEHTGGSFTLDDAVYDESSDTYTWEIPVDQYYRYTVTENDYLYTDENTVTTAQYIKRHDNSGYMSSWALYPGQEGVSITGQVFNEEDVNMHTVSFLNTYIRPGTVVLRKVDSSTGNPVGGISFQLSDSNGAPLYVANSGNGHYSLSDTGGGVSRITTDSNGQAYLQLPAGSYLLREEVPEGYEDPGDLSVVMSVNPDNGHTELASAVSLKDPKYITVRDGVMELVVRNHSITTDLKIQKIWENGENKPVTIQLYYGETAIFSPITLDGVSDALETEPWTYIFYDLPLYVDGERADYWIRETKIGDFSFSAEYENGYRYYIIDYSDLVYLDTEGAVTEEADNIASALLTVSNNRHTGSLSFFKVDEAGGGLSGAVFDLYRAGERGNTLPELPLDSNSFVASATSGANGRVSFVNVYEGQYFLVEREAPSGYQRQEDVYRITFVNGSVTLARWNNGRWESVNVSRVINTRQKSDVVIEKLVTGSLGDKDKSFSFTVSCSEAMGQGDGYTLSSDGMTASFALKHGEQIILKDVPLGAELTVAETNAGQYSVRLTEGQQERQNPVSVSEGLHLTVINYKEAVVDNGAVLDSMPYILMLGIAPVGGLCLLLSRRKKREEHGCIYD